MIGIQGILNFTFLYLITNLFIISCSTDATPVYSSIPDGTTNTPQGNSFEWADYSINICEENDSTLHFDRQYSADICHWCSCGPLGGHSGYSTTTTINSTLLLLLQKQISVSTSTLHG